MHKTLFISSQPSKNKMWDGERNKSVVIKSALEKANRKLIIIDYTKNKYLQTIKMIWHLLFSKCDDVFISKCIIGGTIALNLIRLFNKKIPIQFYIIGNGYIGFEDKKINFKNYNTIANLIVESPFVEEQMRPYTQKVNILIFPSVKPNLDIPFLPKKYDDDSPLKCLFFSRIIEEKGVLDAIHAIEQINDETNKLCFVLDVSGDFGKSESVEQVKEEIMQHSKDRQDINFVGTSINARSKEGYFKIREYDLHLFPTKFLQECAPGSIVDMFIAGVPTLSSKYPSYFVLMSEKNSFFFEQGNYDDFVAKLKYIYNHKNELSEKRFASFNEAKKYSEDVFVEFLITNIYFN